MPKHIVAIGVVGIVGIAFGGASIAAAAPPSSPASFAVIGELTVEPDLATDHTWSESIVRERNDAIEGALLGCVVPTEHATAKVTLTIARDGSVANANSDLARGGACVVRALAAIRFAAFDVPQIEATLTVQLDPGPSGCERVWRLGPRGRLCARGAVVEQVTPSGVVRRMPRTPVLDAAEASLVMTGLCGRDQLAEYGAHALCVVNDDEVSLLFVGMDVAAHVGAIQIADSQLLVANGQTIGVFGPGNKRGGPPWDTDVQKLLVDEGIRPANICTWNVRERLHRAASNGAYRMTFENCAHEPVAVGVTVDLGWEAEQHAFHMRRLAR